MQALTLDKVNEGVCSVVDGVQGHVGNRKRIVGVWKFKAVGYGPRGEVTSGGGPLIDRHNTSFAAPDEALLNAALSQLGKFCPVAPWNPAATPPQQTSA